VKASKRSSASVRPPGATGTIVFRFARPTVIDLLWTGYITGASCGHYPEQLERMLASRRITYAIFDALGVTGFSADSRVPGGRLLAVCKSAGARRVMVVTDSSAIRMIGSTVALATGMSVRFFASREEAFEAIDRHERGD
jgi:CheY-like chemotaxis protein